MVSRSSAADQLVCLFFYVSLSVWFSFGRTVRNQKSEIETERERDHHTLLRTVVFVRGEMLVVVVFVYFTGLEDLVQI